VNNPSYKKLRKLYFSYMRSCQGFWYYGCEVDSWLPEVVLIPYVSLLWKSLPVWLRVIGPPGCGKSDHLTILQDHKMTIRIDELSPRSLVSGFGGGVKGYSKLPLLNNRIMVITDESTFMEMRSDDRNLLQAQLRKAYDGTLSRGVGSLQGIADEKARFNILVASTPQIDRYFHYTQALGERYLNYRLQIPNREAITERAYRNMQQGASPRRGQIARKAQTILNSIIKLSPKLLVVNQEARESLQVCANLISKVRTPVYRDSSGRQIVSLPQPEVAGRLIQQMVQGAKALSLVSGSRRITPLSVDKAIYLGLCSLSSVTAYILFLLYVNRMRTKESRRWFTVQDVVELSSLGRPTVSHELENLSVQHVLNLRHIGDTLVKTIYALKEQTTLQIKAIGLFKYYKPMGRGPKRTKDRIVR